MYITVKNLIKIMNTFSLPLLFLQIHYLMRLILLIQMLSCLSYSFHRLHSYHRLMWSLKALPPPHHVVTVHVVILVIELSRWLSLNTLKERTMMIIISKGIVYHIIAPNIVQEIPYKKSSTLFMAFFSRFGRCFDITRPLSEYKIFYIGSEGPTLTNFMLTYHNNQV